MTADLPTPGEMRALRAYLEAGSVRLAAYQLGLAESTVKGHLKNMRAKLGVRTTAQVVFLLRHELVA